MIWILNPSRPLLTDLRIFEFGSDFAEIFEFVKSSAVCIPPRRQAPRCASYCKVKLLLCITQRSQTAHRGVKIEIFVSLWLLLKGPSGEILLGVNTSITIEMILSKKIWFTVNKILIPRCHANGGVRIFELYDWISQRNPKPNIKGLNGFE